MRNSESGPAHSEEWDPVYLHSRREAILIFIVWLLGLLWAVPFCYFQGYVGNVDPQNVPLILGMPSWLFWGIAVPWVVADLFTVWLCFFYMEDDDLGEADEDADLREEIAEMHAARSDQQSSDPVDGSGGAE